MGCSFMITFRSRVSVMATTRRIVPFDRVELSERVDEVAAGARGGVLELRDPDIAMVEIPEPPLDAVTGSSSSPSLSFAALSRSAERSPAAPGWAVQATHRASASSSR